jgi:hypothetical protein
MMHTGRARTGRGDVLRIDITKAADAAKRCHTLRKGREAAIRAVTSAIIGAPRIILRLGARDRRCRSEKNSCCKGESLHWVSWLCHFAD